MKNHKLALIIINKQYMGGMARITVFKHVYHMLEVIFVCASDYHISLVAQMSLRICISSELSTFSDMHFK